MISRKNLVIALFCGSVLLGAHLGPAANAEDALSREMEHIIADWHIPGMAVAVVKDGQPVFVRGFGICQFGSNLPVTADTRFSIGSCTKSFTAAALGTLVDQQSTSWEDPVVRHLSGFEMPDPCDTARVTVRDLLAHRTGLYGGDLLSWGSSFSRQELVERIRFLRPIAPLRSVFQYNNNTYGAAGEVAHAISGLSWDQLITTVFLQPLGMTSTTTSITAIPGDSNRASPHAVIAGRLQPIPPINEDNIAAAGSIWSTVTDMAQWVLMLLGDGERDNHQILSPSTIEEMWRLQVPMPPEEDWARWPDSARPHFSGYGLGWFLHDSRGRKIVSHEGMSDGMVAGVTLVPEDELGIIVLANLHDSNVVRPVTLTLLDHFSGVDEPTDWNRLYLDLETNDATPSQTPADNQSPEASPSPRPARDLGRYTGTYDNPAIGKASVSLIDTHLHVEFIRTPLYSATLEHLDGDTFLAHRDYPLVEASPIRFEVDLHSGVAIGFIVKPDATEWLASIDYRFEKTPIAGP